MTFCGGEFDWNLRDFFLETLCGKNARRKNGRADEPKA
jgi:hypothetical protein